MSPSRRGRASWWPHRTARVAPGVHRRVLLWACILCMAPFAGACSASGASSPSAQPPPATPTLSPTLSLESDCPGCPLGRRVELYGDGRAVLTATGKARLRTADRVAQGRVPADELRALQQLAQAQGFCALDEIYDDPDTADGPWVMLRLRCGGQLKEVFRREGHGPPALLALERAVQTLLARHGLDRLP